ncbi:hypothetical protein H0H92_006516, partial [Tricholoma furcatifolium]
SSSIASVERDSDVASIKGSVRSIPFTTPAALAPSKPVLSHPSPIPESPVQQNDTEAMQSIVTPSPLVQGPLVAEPEEMASPVHEYTPPPLIDSTAAINPGGFTDEPDELPQPTVIEDPSRAPSLHQADSTDGHDSVIPPTIGPSSPQVVEPSSTQQVDTVMTGDSIPLLVDSAAGAPGAFNDDLDLPQPQVIEDSSRLTPPSRLPTPSLPEPVVNQNPDPIPPPSRLPTPLPEAVVNQNPDPNPDPNESVSYFDLPPQVQPAYEPTVESVQQQQGLNRDVTIDQPAHQTAEAAGIHDDDALKPSYNPDNQIPVSEPTEIPMDDQQFRAMPMPMMPVPEPVAPPMTLPIFVPPPHEAYPSHEVWGGVADAQPEKVMDRDANVQNTSRSRASSIHTISTENLYADPTAPRITVSQHGQATPPPMSMPMPHVPFPSAWPAPETHAPRLHDFGWIEYQLPDSTVYYVHPTRRVTADIDLRDERRLEFINGYFESHRDGTGAPAGTELWLLQDGEPNGRKVFRPPVRLLVNHRQRMVTVDQFASNGRAGSKSKTGVEDDQLDIEYRYWTFVEAHPAHTTLPPSARAEAMDALTWAWTDRLLPLNHDIPGPFSQEECQELMSLLRSFEQNEGGLQTVVHTRVVARILLRVATWRQQYFRPNKPLPTDVGHHEIPSKPRRSIGRALVDFIISCLCLGVPYLFFERSRQSRIDEESGTHNPGPMVIVGACACLTAAIVLSASVTFLSLPGLDNFSRVAGFVAVLFAAFSMVSTLVALFRFKAEMDNPISHIAGEGLRMITKRSVVMSLPLVLLVYAMIAFLTGIVLYSFRGITEEGLFEKHPFEDYTKWTVIAVLGGLGVILPQSATYVTATI